MQQLTGQSFWKNIGIDTVATIVNDLITVGALPLTVAMHAAVGDSAWFSDTRRAEDLADGFADACRRSGAVWGGGETPALGGIVDRAAIVLAGSALGIVRPKNQRITGDLADGDAIVLLGSSGVQTNGLSLCRKLAAQLPQGYLTPLPDGRTYGAALLDPSVIYVPFVSACQRKGVRLKYAAHITGHGWRKLMRAREPFVYRMTDVRPPPPVFSFIQTHGPMDASEAYATFNMGAGFAAYVAPGAVADCLETARSCGIEAWVGGIVTRQGDRKAVEIVPLGITFEADSLQVR
jgi:phosphoribosylformylglycinamidine cyclo-ligase